MFVLLLMSFYGYMRAIGIAMIIFTIRNVLPLYDIEKRQKIMGDTWHFITLFQSLTTMMNLQLVNNLFDNSILFEIFMLLALASGLLHATWTMKTDNMKAMFGNSSLEMVMIAGLVVFRIFLYI